MPAVDLSWGLFEYLFSSLSYLFSLSLSLSGEVGWLFWVSRLFEILFQSPRERDGWMDELRFYVLFNSVSVISGR